MMGPGLFGCCGGWGSFGSYSWIGLILNLIITAAVIGGMVWLVIWAVRRLSSANRPNALAGNQTISQTPQEILQIRYARGEITREQYLNMLEDLK